MSKQSENQAHGGVKKANSHGPTVSVENIAIYGEGVNRKQRRLLAKARRGKYGNSQVYVKGICGEDTP